MFVYILVLEIAVKSLVTINIIREKNLISKFTLFRRKKVFINNDS